MKQYWEQLKPVERRWAVIGGVVVFLMLNYFFIWPHRNDWAKSDARIHAADVKIADYNKEISKKSVYQTKLRMLQADGSEVPTEDQAIDFERFYSTRMYNNHVIRQNAGTLTTRTNAFFTEQQLGINVQAKEVDLVNFLYSLAAGNSMVRVRAMSLRPTPDHHELNAGITMVASYQKKKAAPSSSSTGVTVTPAKNTITPAPKSTPSPAPKPATPARATTSNQPAAPPHSRMTPPPRADATAISNRMARFLRPGMATKPNQ